jgi:hypothetical protein
MLQRIHMISTFRHGSPVKALAPKNVNVLVFLAAFMIALRPTHVFESMGKLEQALYESAVPVINCFQRIVKHVESKGMFQNVPFELTADFPTMLYEYLKRFKLWKVPDEVRLLFDLHFVDYFFIVCFYLILNTTTTTARPSSAAASSTPSSHSSRLSSTFQPTNRRTPSSRLSSGPRSSV